MKWGTDDKRRFESSPKSEMRTAFLDCKVSVTHFEHIPVAMSPEVGIVVVEGCLKTGVRG